MTSAPLPRGWKKHIKSSLLHAISLATAALTEARSRSATDRRRADLERATNEIALLKEELEIKDSRWSRLSSRKRPHYTPIQRMRVLQLKAARGWSYEQAAAVFVVDEQTLKSWLRRIDEEGECALVQLSEPVNRFPDFVRYLVRQLKALCPTMGKVRIAQVLARAGLHLGATTIGRILKETEPVPEDVACTITIETRSVKASYPGELWHVDLTAVPTGAGFWVPWLPYSLPQSWPFCWWVAVVEDHVSRAVVGLAVFRSPPTAIEVQAAISETIRRVGCPPKYIITDQGSQFRGGSWRRCCRGRGIRPRFGAVGKHGSIAIVERFIRALKDECTTRMLVPLNLSAMRFELGLYAAWYNEYRPSQTLGGRTPREVYDGLRPANSKPRIEPRGCWPRESSCASPQTLIRGQRGATVTVVISYVKGRRHLPVVELREAA